jgi:hypothetical protein
VPQVGDLGRPILTSHWTYFVLGLHIRSERPLPELIVHSIPADGVVDIRWRSAPVGLIDPDAGSGIVQISGDDILVTARTVARFHLHAGVEIIVEPEPGASDQIVHAFLLGTVLSLACHQRGLLPLHANAIIVGGRAVAIAGHSGAGKSTLAAHFLDRGFELLSDDVCAVSFSLSGAPIAWSGMPRVRLWADAAAALGKSTDGLEAVHNQADKFTFPLGRTPPPPQGLPLDRIYVLTKPADCPSAEISLLTGSRAMNAIIEQTFRGEFLGPMGGAEQRFARALALSETAPVYCVPWNHDFSRFVADAGRLELHFRDTA